MNVKNKDKKFYVAIGFAAGESGGRNRSKPVVFGMGYSIGLAVLEAESYDIDWDSAGHAQLEVTPAIAQRIRDNVTDCAKLGIHAKLDARGFIVGAEIGPDAL